MKKTNLQIIRKAVILANPVRLGNKGETECIDCESNLCTCPWRLLNGGVDKENLRPIRLADVLLAIGEKTKRTFGYYCTDTGIITQTNTPDKWCRWNLRDDRLEALKDEDLQFLADLLATK